MAEFHGENEIPKKSHIEQIPISGALLVCQFLLIQHLEFYLVVNAEVVNVKKNMKTNAR